MRFRAGGCAAVLLLVFLAATAPARALWGIGEHQEKELEKLPTRPRTPDDDYFWHNEKTGETTWFEPKYEHTSEEGSTYFVDPDTKETVWERPTSLAWKSMESEKGTYYYNEVTGESSWDKPTMLAWRRLHKDTKAEL